TSLYREITAIWLTDEIRRKRPTPREEAKWGFAVIENSLWHAIPQYLRELDHVCKIYTGQALPLNAIPIRFGSWMGGDRDGNPNVTHQVTQQVCFLGRWSAANLYEKAMRNLIAELSMKDCDAEVRKIVGDHPEPYRALLKPVREILKEDLQTLENCLADQGMEGVLKIIAIDQLLEPLLLCYNSLKKIGAAIIAEGSLLDLIRRINCFGLTLARLDIRQEASRHQGLMQEILTQNRLHRRFNEEDSVEWLLNVCINPAQLTIDPKLFTTDSLEVWQTILLINQQPPDTFGAYVISMTKKPVDIIIVYALQKLAGVVEPIRVVPLFETLADLQSASHCLETLFRTDSYRNLIRSKQEVMIGYSDSAKDAGIIAANWAIYLAQEQCLKIAEKYDIQLTLFHGRGGTVGRGGSPAYMAIVSQPPGAVHGSMRITEQGEVIRTKFGFTKNAIRTLELYTSAIFEAYCNKPPVPQKNWRVLMDKIAQASCSFYRNTIYKDPKFVPYFFAVTPIDEIGKLFISSRPVKRGSKAGIEVLRAIPWIFAWTQNRMMTPSWLGVGDALQSLNGQEKIVLRDMVEKWPFFKSLISLIEMVIAKTDPSIALHYEQCLAPFQLKEIGEKIRNDFNHTYQIVKELLKIHNLLESNNTLDRSLKVRQPYVYPLNILQAELLAKVRNGEASSSEYHEALLISISGIAAGMRNTG
ncbi:MAG TPA: phosphoenolpyruvate carboxylase, partial [Gammaproteobacteria bacterium]|nr:phosphoenolpyruvate carboxylase [Gammaproteobacteria bacterium]